MPKLSSRSLVLVPALAFIAAAVACGSPNGKNSGFEPQKPKGASESAASPGDPSSNPSFSAATVDGGSRTPAFGDSGTSASGNEACTATQTFPVTALPSNVMILLDRSGSMQIRLTAAAGGGTRWTAMRDALKGLLTLLPPETRAGAMMFPQGDPSVDQCCGITAADVVHCTFTATCAEPGPADRCDSTTYQPGVVLGALDSARAAAINSYVASSDTEFYWGTPTGPALSAAVASMRAAQVDGTKAVILLTDGYPETCGTDDEDAQAAIDAASSGLLGLQPGEQPVRTYVVAVTTDDNTGARADLSSQIASAGGTARAAGCDATNSCFYPINQANFAKDVAATFQEISTATFDCTFTLPPASEGTTRDPSKVNVQITGGGNGDVVLRDPSHQSGWDYTGSDANKIELYGAACDALKADSTKSVQIAVGCMTQVAQVN